MAPLENSGQQYHETGSSGKYRMECGLRSCGPSSELMGTFRVPSRYSTTIIALSHVGFWRSAPNMRANGSLAPSRAGQAFWILGPSASGSPRGPQKKKTFCRRSYY